jgi:hypothetical protein
MKVFKNMTMGVLVLATASCASSSAPPLQPPTVNVTGDWVGTWTCDFMREGSGVVVLSLTQSGSRVTGPLLVTNSTFNRVSTMPDGVVSGDTVLTQSNDLSGTFTGVRRQDDGAVQDRDLSGESQLGAGTVDGHGHHVTAAHYRTDR